MGCVVTSSAGVENVSINGLCRCINYIINLSGCMVCKILYKK